MLNDDRFADRDLRVVLDVIKRADRARESHFAHVLFADRVECGIGVGDRRVDVGLDFDRRLWPIGNDQDLVRLFGGCLKIGKTLDALGMERKGGSGEQTQEQEVFHRNSTWQFDQDRINRI